MVVVVSVWSAGAGSRRGADGVRGVVGLIGAGDWRGVGVGVPEGRALAPLLHVLHVGGPPPRFFCSHTFLHVGHRFTGIEGSWKKESAIDCGSFARCFARWP